MPISSRVLGLLAGARSGSSFTMSLSAAPASGEYVTALVTSSYDQTSGSAVTGYGALGSNSGIRTQYMPWMQMFAKFAGSSEGTSLTITRTDTASRDYGVIVLGHTGVDTTTPTAGGPTFTAGPSSGSDSVPEITPAAEGIMMWMLAHQNYRAAADSDIAWDAVEFAQAVSTFILAGVALDGAAGGAGSGTRAWTVSPWGGNTPACECGLALRAAAVSSVSEAGRYLMTAA